MLEYNTIQYDTILYNITQNNTGFLEHPKRLQELILYYSRYTIYNTIREHHTKLLPMAFFSFIVQISSICFIIQYIILTVQYKHRINICLEIYSVVL